LDVNDDGVIFALDVLAVINRLNAPVMPEAEPIEDEVFDRDDLDFSDLDEILDDLAEATLQSH
jgi:hypothetical protein